MKVPVMSPLPTQLKEAEKVAKVWSSILKVASCTVSVCVRCLFRYTPSLREASSVGMRLCVATTGMTMGKPPRGWPAVTGGGAWSYWSYWAPGPADGDDDGEAAERGWPHCGYRWRGVELLELLGTWPIRRG